MSAFGFGSRRGRAPVQVGSETDGGWHVAGRPAAVGEALGGWLDSSLELRRGLDVMEDLALDSLPPEVADIFRTG